MYFKKMCFICVFLIVKPLVSKINWLFCCVVLGSYLVVPGVSGSEAGDLPPDRPKNRAKDSFLAYVYTKSIDRFGSKKQQTLNEEIQKSKQYEEPLKLPKLKEVLDLKEKEAKNPSPSRRQLRWRWAWLFGAGVSLPVFLSFFLKKEQVSPPKQRASKEKNGGVDAPPK